MSSLFQESKLNKNDSTKDVKFQQQNSLRSIQNSQENYTKSLQLQQQQGIQTEQLQNQFKEKNGVHSLSNTALCFSPCCFNRLLP